MSNPAPALSAYMAKVSYDDSNLNAHATGGLLEVYGKAKAGFEPNWNGTKAKGGKDVSIFGVDVRGDVQVSAVEAGVYGKLGDNQFGVDGDAHGHIGTASANAGFTARADRPGLGARVGAEASVFDGNISGGVTVFGYEIEVGLEGSAFGVGARAEIGYIDGRFKARAKVIAGLGAGAWLSVGKKE
ncbi:MAG TPA: hypothetical protein VEG39_14270 [Clostridia bacterium]|nr:hypothetical protein [Clostridia bacterium]